MTRREIVLLSSTAMVMLLTGGFASWWFMFKTDQGLTYWASTIGTAIGGMLAVAAAVILWQAEARAGRRQSIIDSNARTVEVILNSTRRMKSIVSKGPVYDGGYPDVLDDVAAGVTEQVEEITSASIWIRDKKIRTELIEITTYFSSNTNFIVLGPDVHYAARIHQICKWLGALCEDLLRLENKRGDLPHRAEYSAAWAEVEAMWAEEDRWRTEDAAEALVAKEKAKQQQTELPAENQ